MHDIFVVVVNHKLCIFVSGSYTDSPGIEVIRKHVAQYIERRDGGIPCDWQDVILSAGASDGIKVLLMLLIILNLILFFNTKKFRD
jgi:aspartate/methionine/tyrosine aminotransferase